MLDSPLIQFVIFGLAMIGFILLVKFSVNMLPSTGVVGDVRKVILTV